ncbi:hypothetical protein TRICHSKD4_3323 [Roseibium sp. TrichSKD4]|uniref:helix-turn-helix domain-containing protein n=1 Tax=Roseibium sp. TrichSKD4 TaxID=744980 RepID=UPI0001E56F2F|nr:helix-turn-helix transcriptional regulator [Roseibium sp. TrichSKD4]EFO31306.1 hypothetical protein TRICHSKD4_3323 [Roseibium sp. TrichSKD4]
MIDAGIIERTVGITRKTLGLTLNEMKEDLAALTACVDDPSDRGQMRAALNAYEAEQKALGIRPMTGEVLRDARKELKLTGSQLAPLIGLKPSASVRSHISQMELGRIPIQAHHVRLIRAYLSGYRPHDWPK